MPESLLEKVLRSFFLKSTSERRDVAKGCEQRASTKKMLSSFISWSLSLLQLFACFDVFFLFLQSLHWMLNSIPKLKSTSCRPAASRMLKTEFSIGNWIRAGRLGGKSFSCNDGEREEMAKSADLTAKEERLWTMRRRGEVNLLPKPHLQ